jgi:hypothetical protein
MIKSAPVAAEMALADLTRFVLPAGKWLSSEPSAFGPA